MKYVNKVLIVVSFVAIILLLIAFTSISPFTDISYAWQCALCGFFGLLWITCLLIEIRKK
jgi:membrane associated rhomboid family serine protease